VSLSISQYFRPSSDIPHGRRFHCEANTPKLLKFSHPKKAGMTEIGGTIASRLPKKEAAAPANLLNRKEMFQAIVSQRRISVETVLD